MASITTDATLADFANFISSTYSLSNDRYYSQDDMLNNINRFVMRALKGIRQGDADKTRANLLIAMSWFTSLTNRLHINVGEVVLRRFPYQCSYCGACPCVCKRKKIKARQNSSPSDRRRPQNIHEIQQMFEEIYPPASRSLEHAGIHLGEEMGELSEALFLHMAKHGKNQFDHVYMEAADFYSCCMGLFNSLGMDYATALSEMYSDNCHVCHKAPCECSFDFVSTYKS